ncbi:MAG: hypothetical protein MUC49_03650 [Raineya sp.]|jgi:hypothetical protein|nr:hypothetical protein [Raineya sp.]
MNTPLKQKNTIAPIIVLVSGLVSAFAIAPITGQNAIEKEYRWDFSKWEETEKDIQKNVINWFKPSEIESFTKDFDNVKSSYKNVKNLYEQKKKSYSVIGLQDVYTEMQIFKTNQFYFYNKYTSLINLKSKTRKDIEGITAQQKMLNSNVENLKGKIKESPFEERHKKALLDCLAVFGTSNHKIDNSLQLMSEFYSPNYEGKSAVSQHTLMTNSAIAEAESKRMMGNYEYANNLFVGFVNAPKTVPNSIISLSRNINLIKLETNSSISQPKMLMSGSPAMKKTDSLLKICMNLLPQAQIKSTNKEYIDALFILEKLAPYETALMNEYNTQKESYNNFIAQYNAIDKDLKATKSASISSSDRSSYDRLSNEAFLAQQLAWQYAMAGNWMYAQNQLQTSSEKSNKVYNLAFKKPSTRSYSSSSSSGSKNYGSGNSYSGSKSSGGSSSNKSSSGSSYSSSSKKSDSRSWSSSSSSSSKKSSSSSSSSSRRSDSRSWGSSSKKKR